ncbi:MAG: OmpA family protein [Caulobacteraceae bacterium]|nr:OmpA family protein [Caulobacteraceae bacterium]
MLRRPRRHRLWQQRARRRNSLCTSSGIARTSTKRRSKPSMQRSTARQCNVSGTIVVGHTDTSGSPTYNQGLSERRASVVRDALVARGMAAGSIQTQARGEGDLARPTRDGVREPLNRRTAVTISFR